MTMVTNPTYSANKYAKNSILNIISNILPIFVGLVSIPFLIKGMGIERFGIINIAWMLIGYFSLFDMGLGRALTQLVAKKIGNNEHDEIPGIFWTSTVIMLVFGVAGTISIAVFSPAIVHSILKIPLPMQQETLYSLLILAGSIPFVILSTGFIGFISAYQRFDIIYAIRIPLGSFMYAGPLLVLPFTGNLIHVIIILTVARIIVLFIYLHYCLRILPVLKDKIMFQRSIIKPLLRFGGWMTVSNIISPIMVYFDRFFIGAVISLSAVAYYTTPFELVNRILIIPLSVISVLFPAFAETYQNNKEVALQIYGGAVRYLFIILFPVALLLTGFAHEGLQLWLGKEFAHQSFPVLQWLALGVFINSLALVPCSFLQGIGKPGIATVFHLVELCLYIPLLWFCAKRNGIEGAAMVWAIRVTIDAVLLFYYSWRVYRPIAAFSMANILCLFGAVPVLFAFHMVSSFNIKVILLLFVMIVFCMVSWRYFITGIEKRFIANSLFAKLKARSL